MLGITLCKVFGIESFENRFLDNDQDVEKQTSPLALQIEKGGKMNELLSLFMNKSGASNEPSQNYAQSKMLETILKVVVKNKKKFKTRKKSKKGKYYLDKPM